MGALDGKVAAVTGSTSGSGLGIAKRFVEEGAHVVMLARGPERLAEYAAELGDHTVPIATDVGDPDSVRAAFDQIEQRFGKLDILINNAAVYRPCMVESLQRRRHPAAGEHELPRPGVHVARRDQAPARRGRRRHRERVERVHPRPFPMLSMYVATKAALEMFDRILAEELRDDDIRVPRWCREPPSVPAAGPPAGSGNRRTPPRPMSCGGSWVCSTVWVGTPAASRWKTSVTCTSSSSRAHARRSSTRSTAAASSRGGARDALPFRSLAIVHLFVGVCAPTRQFAFIPF